MQRYAIIHSASSQIAAYMPGNYQVIWQGDWQDSGTGHVTVIAGEDNAGWTLDDYVLPRLASGMYFGKEIDPATHPVMKLVPAGYKVEVIADDSGKWSGNALRFHTINQATDYAVDLASRWTLVSQWRVVDPTGEVHQEGTV